MLAKLINICTALTHSIFLYTYTNIYIHVCRYHRRSFRRHISATSTAGIYTLYIYASYYMSVYKYISLSKVLVLHSIHTHIIHTFTAYYTSLHPPFYPYYHTPYPIHHICTGPVKAYP